MVDQLSSFADQVTRVAREVGSDGILGGQADVPGVAGVWANLTDSVNFMIRTADSVDAVADLVAFHLHCPLSKLPEAQRERLLSQAGPEQSLAGRKVLIVDDDMRPPTAARR